MNIGIFKIKIEISSSQSLKDKRQVVSSLITKIRNQFKVAVAEVDDLDSWQWAQIGVTAVSNDQQVIKKLFSHLLDYIREQEGNFVLQEQQQEIIQWP